MEKRKWPLSRDISDEEATRRFNLSPIIKRFGAWAVTEYGVECCICAYFFEKGRVFEADWIPHMTSKSWCRGQVGEDFVEAITFARELTSHQWRAPKAAKMGSVGQRLRFLVLKRDKYKCQMCGKSADDGAVLEVDHKIPRAKGGDHSLENLWTLCHECNGGKSDLSL